MSRPASHSPASAGRPLLPALALLAALLAGACAPASGSAAEPVATSSVDLPRSYKFAPQAITIPAGTTVTWTNNDNFTHNVRFDGEEPATMSPGERVTRTFDTAGTYPYLCSLHPTDMVGTVIVTGG